LKIEAYLSFQILNLAGERRVSHQQPVCGASVLLLLADSRKISQIPGPRRRHDIAGAALPVGVVVLAAAVFVCFLWCFLLVAAFFVGLFATAC
jgi:hypothetical protein